MNGETLYEIFKNKMAEQGTGLDLWDALDITDRIAWNAVAESVR